MWSLKIASRCIIKVGANASTISGLPFERIGVERYTYCDGRIAEKDVYSRPDLQAAA